MSNQLQGLLGLPAAKRAEATEQKEKFGRAFRKGMADLNRVLQVVAAKASQEEHKQLNVQRERLCAAFQKASKQIDPTDPGKGDKAVEQVLAALSSVDGKAATAASDATASHKRWLEREGEFDDVLLQIRELADGGHDKASALRKLGDAIRQRVNDRKYRESLAALDELRPNLDQYYAEYQEQARLTAEAEQAAKDGLPAEERDALWQEFEALERRLEQIMAEHKIKL